jgi:hypothetical protein
VNKIAMRLTGDALSVTVEPFGKESLGIEFIKIKSDSQKEYHSAKRQKSGASWTIADLTSGEPAKSILGRLFEKLNDFPNSRVVFVSGTTANELLELTEQARAKSFSEFSDQ